MCFVCFVGNILRLPSPVVNTCTIAVKVIPNAPRSEIVGWLGEALKVKIHAPPVDGRANDALCAFLADLLGLPLRAVAVRHGETSRLKVLAIACLTRAEFDAKLVLKSVSAPQKNASAG